MGKIIISGGGTGGHVYPAIAIADGLKYFDKTVEILFVGGKGKMEMEKVPAAGYNITGLWISGLQRRLTIKNLSFPFKLLHSLIKSRKILKHFKPDVVVGVGGYASGPILYMAAKLHIPILILEQNSYAGLTNKLLAKKADRICVAYEGMEKFFLKEKILITGNPVRKDIMNVHLKRAEALKYFDLSENKKTILVTGGSLGARTINESIALNLADIVNSGFQLIWQAGRKYKRWKMSPLTGDHLKGWEDGRCLPADPELLGTGASVQAGEMEGIRILEFIDRMDLAYAASDIVISRAGAIALSELCLAKKPAILVPSPNVAEDHQTKNALALVNKNAAVLIKDEEAREKLVDTALALLNDEERKNILKENIGKLAKPGATEVIAKEILGLVG
ncbi:MAG: UDP-N-acetylglucosamine--N-acetylmuramyl-(pentapeptide) pyrophosphoryl-undecaprenol N-acetylglucosamine transferase [Cytophagales bacterium]|nr:UDP-N-acetylglucosamine--N-acetylmuramyl-(pentapeptide) pyrophosphoryl-undecaprenol N-acetylglucosamine transferase [Cytophagales bacterium]